MNKTKYLTYVVFQASALLIALSGRAASTTVQIVDFAFSPPTVSINMGDSITWTNTGTAPHTSTSGTSPTADGLWTSGFLSPTMSFTHQFNSSGNFPYFCQVHTFMTGSVTVQGAANVPPVVAITSPTNGQVFAAPGNVTLQANASDSDGSVAQVQFLDDQTSLGIVTNTSAGNTSFTLSASLSPGNHTLTAIATDNLGATTTSASVMLTVQAPSTNAPPVVAINSPTNGEAFTTGTNITISASASDPDGSVAQVQFMDGATSLGISTNTSAGNTSFTLGVSLASGSHTLTAIATDNLGAMTTSAAIMVTVGGAASTNATLTAMLSGTNLVVSWTPPGGTLQSTTALEGAATVWTDVGTANPATLQIGAGNLFLRVRE